MVKSGKKKNHVPCPKAGTQDVDGASLLAVVSHAEAEILWPGPSPREMEEPKNGWFISGKIPI